MKKIFILSIIGLFFISPSLGVLTDVIKLQKKLKNMQQQHCVQYIPHLRKDKTLTNIEIENCIGDFISDVFMEKNPHNIWIFCHYLTEIYNLKESIGVHQYTSILKYLSDKKSKIFIMNDNPYVNSFISLIYKIEDILKEIQYMTSLEYNQDGRKILLTSMTTKEEKYGTLYATFSSINTILLKNILLEENIDLFSFIKEKNKLMIKKNILLEELLKNITFFINDCEILKQKGFDEESIDDTAEESNASKEFEEDEYSQESEEDCEI